MRAYTFADIEIGLQESFSRDITAEMENKFRQISGDENPLHMDDSFAYEISGGKYSSHVTFGLLTASLYSTLAGMYLPGKYSLIHSLENLSFQQPVFTGDKLTVEGKVVDKDESLHLLRIKAVIKNQNNKTVSKAMMKVMVMQ
ncbi:MaoC/PaaZ C-terminal domain-containing protein [Anaerovibrio lipolyticus]|uniref:MaoC/PaaZ C-terminal domain-containing protein n=1 Tax=Anaerovibrio lipolyticus TaxID=82374 RepID=UPI0026E949E4|nr:MaoC/PaaZ C-terminal domain-containing protein [Anaerovibrio lipolyticus]MBE6105450.1 dehydratase [Anaerovibrio lipolyticus]